MSNGHVHKYLRLKTVKDKSIWRCTLPGCTHVLYQPELVIGRECLCWSCNRITTVLDMERRKPLCENCREVRNLRRIG